MSRLEKPYVLLVDDNEATCTLITAILHRDYTVDIATDGSEALEKLRTRSYAAVLLDLVMPHIDGFGVLDHLRDQSPEILKRVIVLTASVASREIERVRPYAVCGIIVKPFEVETLLNAVRECVDPDTARDGRGAFFSSGMLVLLADLLRQRLIP